MPTRKHIINVHTGTETGVPTGATLYLGEIAVQHTPDNPGLWIKMGTSEESSTYEQFIGKTEVQKLVDNSNTLGSGYTYSGLPYIVSSTTIADAYSALTNEMIDDEQVVAAAINYVDGRISETSGGLITEISNVVTGLSNHTQNSAIHLPMTNLSISNSFSSKDAKISKPVLISSPCFAETCAK